MEVKTGKIKAIANLGRNNDGDYWEIKLCYPAFEPGSTLSSQQCLLYWKTKK
jgi:cell division protein FtsI (penicillin-binding protein 3)